MSPDSPRRVRWPLNTAWGISWVLFVGAVAWPINDTPTRLHILACTADGVHVLIYVGDRTWISASTGRPVVEIRAEPPNEGWFEVPVKIARWRQLEMR